MKKCGVFLATVLVLFALVGCSSAKDNEAQSLVREYQTKLYHVINEETKLDSESVQKLIEGYRNYFTDRGFNQFKSNRIWLVPMTAGTNGKFDLELNDIKFKKYPEEENGKLIYDYDLNIKLLYINGTASTITMHGQVALLYVNGQWRIDNDWVYLDDVILKNLI